MTPFAHAIDTMEFFVIINGFNAERDVYGIG